MSSNEAVATIDPVNRQVEGKSIGATFIRVQKPDQSTWPDAAIVTVSDQTPLGYIRTDPIVSSLRLSVINNAVSRLTPGSVSLTILDSLFYLDDDREVTVSVVLSDGHRLLVTDPNEIRIESSNASVVNVTSSNYVRAMNEGVAYLNVSWIVCNVVISSEVVEISVFVNRYTPTFTPDAGSAVVPENSAIGYPITTVEAVDEDIHSDVQYNLQDGFFDEIFAVDKITGVVTLIAPLDREQEDQYVLVIEATDQEQRFLIEKCMETTTTEAPTEVVSSGSGMMDTTAPPVDNTNNNNDNTSCIILINTFTVSIQIDR